MALVFRKIFSRKKLTDNNNPTKEKTVNVLVMGKAAVGKTSLVKKLLGEDVFTEHYQPTLYDDWSREVTVEEYRVTFKFMELGGTQAFPVELNVFIQQAHIYLLVYAADDCESHNTLVELRNKVVDIKKKGYHELPIIVVRNKSDVRKRQSKADRTRRKSVANWCYLNHNVSAKSGHHVNSIMDNLIEESKFIGNQDDDHHLKVSGRYIYSEKTGEEKGGRYGDGCSVLFLLRHYRCGYRQSENKRKGLSVYRKNNERGSNDSGSNEKCVIASSPEPKRTVSSAFRGSFRRLRGKGDDDNDEVTINVTSVGSETPTPVDAVRGRRSLTWPESQLTNSNQNSPLVVTKMSPNGHQPDSTGTSFLSVNKNGNPISESDGKRRLSFTEDEPTTKGQLSIPVSFLSVNKDIIPKSENDLRRRRSFTSYELNNSQNGPFLNLLSPPKDTITANNVSHLTPRGRRHSSAIAAESWGTPIQTLSLDRGNVEPEVVTEGKPVHGIMKKSASFCVGKNKGNARRPEENVQNSSTVKKSASFYIGKRNNDGKVLGSPLLKNSGRQDETTPNSSVKKSASFCVEKPIGNAGKAEENVRNSLTVKKSASFYIGRPNNGRSGGSPLLKHVGRQQEIDLCIESTEEINATNIITSINQHKEDKGNRIEGFPENEARTTTKETTPLTTTKISTPQLSRSDVPWMRLHSLNPWLQDGSVDMYTVELPPPRRTSSERRRTIANCKLARKVFDSIPPMKDGVEGKKRGSRGSFRERFSFRTSPQEKSPSQTKPWDEVPQGDAGKKNVPVIQISDILDGGGGAGVLDMGAGGGMDRGKQLLSKPLLREGSYSMNDIIDMIK